MLAERDGFVQSGTPTSPTSWPRRVSKLSDCARVAEQGQLRRQLVELRADRDATVLTVAKVSVGSVLQSGQQFITLVPTDAPLEVEANIAGRDDGYVHVGDPVAIKFDTFPFTQYGMAYGTVRIISADSFTAQDEQRNPDRRGAGADADAQQCASRITGRASPSTGWSCTTCPASFHLMPGMPVTADIKVGKQTVLQYLLQRVLPVTKEGMREP